MQIRRATEADVELLRRLWSASISEATFTPYPSQPFDASLVTEHVALVAEADGEALGTAYVNMGSADFGYVFGVYVVPGARRRGVARRLMRAVADLLAREGRPYVLLSVDTENARARALYAGLGFEDAARMLRADVGRLREDAAPER